VLLTLLVGWQQGHPACKKLEWWGAGKVVCLECSADLHMAQLMPLPLNMSCFSKIQIGFTFLVPAHPGSPGQRAVCVWWEDVPKITPSVGGSGLPHNTGFCRPTLSPQFKWHLDLFRCVKTARACDLHTHRNIIVKIKLILVTIYIIAATLNCFKTA